MTVTQLEELAAQRNRLAELYGPALTDTVVAERLGISATTARRIRLAEEDLQAQCDASLSERWGGAQCVRLGFYDPVAGGFRCARHEVRG